MWSGLCFGGIGDFENGPGNANEKMFLISKQYNLTNNNIMQYP